MNLERITTQRINSVSDLIDLEEKLEPGEWAFRGQSQTYGTLVPSFQRIFTAKKSPGTAHIIEHDLMETFREHYQKLDVIPEGMPDGADIAAGNDLHCLSVMQHYGVPTRLLDWTTKFWTAVYFACAGHSEHDAELWFYKRVILPNTYGVALDLRDASELAEIDFKLTPRMREQQGHHTVCSDIFADHGPLLQQLAFDYFENDTEHEMTEESEMEAEEQLSPATDEVDESGGIDPLEGGFCRCVIASSCKEKALRFLDEHRSITASTLFPDVEGLGRFLQWHLETLVTTLL